MLAADRRFGHMLHPGITANPAASRLIVAGGREFFSEPDRKRALGRQQVTPPARGRRSPHPGYWPCWRRPPGSGARDRRRGVRAGSPPRRWLGPRPRRRPLGHRQTSIPPGRSTGSTGRPSPGAGVRLRSTRPAPAAPASIGADRGHQLLDQRAQLLDVLGAQVQFDHVASDVESSPVGGQGGRVVQVADQQQSFSQPGQHVSWAMTRPAPAAAWSPSSLVSRWTSPAPAMIGAPPCAATSVVTVVRSCRGVVAPEGSSLHGLGDSLTDWGILWRLWLFSARFRELISPSRLSAQPTPSPGA
jgi:hypothetical protein